MFHVDKNIRQENTDIWYLIFCSHQDILNITYISISNSTWNENTETTQYFAISTFNICSFVAIGRREWIIKAEKKLEWNASNLNWKNYDKIEFKASYLSCVHISLFTELSVDFTEKYSTGKNA